MDTYEDAWPIAAIVREHRRRSLYGTREGLLHWQRRAVRTQDLRGTAACIVLM